MAKHPTKTYTEADKELAYRALALADGNARLASRELAQVGLTIPHQTLYPWTKHDRYRQVQSSEMDEIRARARDRAMTVANLALDASVEAIEDWQAKKKDQSAGEASRASKDFTTVYGITVDKVHRWAGEAERIVEHRLEDNLAALKRLGIEVSMDGEAIEIADADVVELAPEQLGA